MDVYSKEIVIGLFLENPVSFSKISLILERETSIVISSRKLRAGIEGKGELPDHIWNALEDVLRSLPDAPRVSYSHVPKRYRERNANYIEITDALRDELELAITKKKPNITLICKQRPPEIDGLSPAVVSGWRSGRSKTAHKDAWAYVMARLKEK